MAHDPTVASLGGLASPRAPAREPTPPAGASHPSGAFLAVLVLCVAAGMLADSAVEGNLALFAGLASVIGGIGIVAWRRRAGVPLRGISLPVAVSSLLFLGTLAAVNVARVSIAANGSIDELLGWLLLPCALALPVAFLVELIRTEYATQATVRRLLDRLVSPESGSWRDALADALDDPGLRLVTWDARTATYRDHCGRVVELVDPAGDRAWIEVHRGGEPVAAILADRRVLDAPEVLATATNTTLVATELHAAQHEADSLRGAIVDAAESARAELGRDLHDSAQQRLIALRIHVGLAKERFDSPDERRVLDAIGTEVEATLADIRSVAHLDGPPALRADGLAGALRSATSSAGIQVIVEGGPVPRAPAEVERAVYYTCLEAVQNAAKHAGRGASVRIRLAARGDGLAFTVTDDGMGLAADSHAGAGLEIMRARVRAVGGWLRVHSVPGGGTSVVGRVPLGGSTTPA